MDMSGLYRSDFPSRIYLETTTRCNLACDMCVKQSSDGCIAEGDFSGEMITSIESTLPYINTLILSGIGEPLLYPELGHLIEYASRRMNKNSRIGFQTNGMLTDGNKVRDLVEAGLNYVCVSIDAYTPETFSSMRKGGDIGEAENALRLFSEEGKKQNRKVRAGIEMVLTTKNLDHLVPVIDIASRAGAEFAIVTHLIPYDERIRSLAAYDRNTDRAIELYQEKLHEARLSAIDITKYPAIRWKFSHTSEEEKIIKTVEELKARAARENVFLNLNGVMNMDSGIRTEVTAVFEKAAKAAEKLGIELILPAAAPRSVKRCDFIESGSIFVSWNGDVHPCHFLWHKFQCYVSGWKKYVNPVVFGNLKEKSLAAIWNSPDYIKFRETVARYEYPVCSNCGFAPCDYIYSEFFEQDCYTNTIPCCDCQWCLGLFQCLQ